VIKFLLATITVSVSPRAQRIGIRGIGNSKTACAQYPSPELPVFQNVEYLGIGKTRLDRTIVVVDHDPNDAREDVCHVLPRKTNGLPSRMGWGFGGRGWGCGIRIEHKGTLKVFSYLSIENTEKSFILQIEMMISAKVLQRTILAILWYLFHIECIFSPITNYLKLLFQFVK
jgi:hypothetical protein